jgi:hypothetical protein
MCAGIAPQSQRFCALYPAKYMNAMAGNAIPAHGGPG